MAYNNGFPINYPQYYPQYQSMPVQQMQQQIPQQMPQQPQAQPQQVNSNMIWVSGEAGAKAYLVAPNTTVQLWDSEKNVIYIKSADASGMPSIKTLDYTIRDTATNTQTLVNDDGGYIKKEELEALKGQIHALEQEINKLKPRKKEGERNG